VDDTEVLPSASSNESQKEPDSNAPKPKRLSLFGASKNKNEKKL